MRTIRTYLAELSREQVAHRTLAAHLSAIRSFYRWMAAEGIVEGDAVSAISSPKLPRDLPGVLTTQQVEELLRQEEQNKKNDPSYDPGKVNGATGSMMWPCPSCHTITSPFGWRYHPIYQTQKYHSGVDIGASYGATIVAADGGTIITAGSVSGYGNCVVINHGNGITTLYGHMSSIAVSVGQKVSKGQTIGYVGSTGNSTGPHLHWEVTVNGVRQNPLNYAT